MEGNQKINGANLAPLGPGILGRIDPSRDHDMYRFTIPDSAKELSVSVEQSGPGEVRPRVRIFTSAGELLTEQVAKKRGRNLYFNLPVSGIPGDSSRELVVSVEDFLGRYSSMFPYVLRVAIVEPKKES
jgi:hypothetical protein